MHSALRPAFRRHDHRTGAHVDGAFLAERSMRLLDATILIVAPLLAFWAVLALKLSYFASELLFFVPLGAWLSYRTPHRVLKTLVFAICLSIPIAVIVDYIAWLDASWTVPTTVLPYTYGHIWPVEDFLVAFLLAYTIVIFYEHFLDKGKAELIDRRMKYFALPCAAVLAFFAAYAALGMEFPRIPYAYVGVGVLLMLLPILTFLRRFPRLLAKYVKTASYFSVFLILFEIAGVRLGHWRFDGAHYVGWVTLGDVRFPFEEFFFWCVLTTVTVLTYFEFFDDDRR